MTDIQDAWRAVLDSLPQWAEKIAPLYARNGWVWVHMGGEARAPTAKEIHGLAYSLLWASRRQAEEDGRIGIVSSGRLTARFVRWESNWTATVDLAPEWIRS